MAEEKPEDKGSTPEKKSVKKKTEKKAPSKKAAAKKTAAKGAAPSKKTPQKKAASKKAQKKKPPAEEKREGDPADGGKPEETGEKEAQKDKKKEPATEKPKPEKKRAPKPVEKIKHPPKGVAKERQDVAAERKKLKGDVPTFRRADQWRLKCIPESWRRPRGVDSKQHLEKRGKPRLPKIGYKKPDELSGIHPTGLRPVRIATTKELESLDAAVQGAIIASCVGRRSRNRIIAHANERGITILNPRKDEQ